MLVPISRSRRTKNMLIRISKKKEIKASQKTLQKNIEKAIGSVENGTVGYRGGNVELKFHTRGHGELWSAFTHLKTETIPRYGNAFGVFDEDKKMQMITVEINIPTQRDTRQVAGYFAKDTETGAIYLMHTGKVGGGRKGIGKNAFLAFSEMPLTKTVDQDGNMHGDILIGRIDSKQLVNRVWHFVQLVNDFKDAVQADGEALLLKLKERTTEIEGYQRESSGQRSGRVDVVLDYISYHGDIVEALKAKCEAFQRTGQQVVNSILIDLYTVSQGTVTAVFEVKTSLNRQALYTAIGQVFTHSVSSGPSAACVLVIPVGDIHRDIAACLKEKQISVVRYRLVGDEVEFEEGLQNPFVVVQ